MPNDSNDIRRSFVEERRSLLITSFVLFFYQQAGLQIDKINVFGNEARISDPWWITFVLWVLWGYFLVRFYQYFRSIPDKGFWTAYEQQMEKLITRRAFKHFKKHFKKFLAQKGSKYDFKIRNASFPMKFPNYWSAKLEVSVAETHEPDRVAGSSRSPQEDFTGYELWGIKTRAVAHVLFSTQVATEYFLPFILALLPLVNLLRKL